MKHDARSVANEIIRHAHDDGKSVTHLQVQKLVYYCHAWMLGLYGEPLLKQPVEAWEYGPVIRAIYDSLRQYPSSLRPVPWYHGNAAFIHCHLAPMRLTQRNNLAIRTAALLNRRALAISELAASHHQRKKRIRRFLSNDNFAPISAQCALIPAICQLAGIKGFTPVMTYD